MSLEISMHQRERALKGREMGINGASHFSLSHQGLAYKGARSCNLLKENYWT